MPRRPSDGTIIELFLPVSDVQLYVQYLRPKSQLAVQLRFFRERGKQIYRSFVLEKQILERELRIPITWSDGAQPEIVAVKGDVSIKDPLDWLEQHEWITATLARFAETFHNRIVTTHAAIKEKSEAKQLLLDFWLGFHSYLYQHGNSLPHTAAQSSNNNDFPTGRSAFWYSTIVAPTSERLTVALMVGSDVSRRAWPGLVAESQAIESAVGAQLEWNSPVDQKIWTVKTHRNDSPLNDRSRWGDWYEWLFNQLQAFDKAFRHRIAALRLEDELESTASGTLSPDSD